jgi:plastocyanin
MSKVVRWEMISIFFQVSLFAGMVLIFSALSYPLSRTIAYASPFSSEDSLLGQQGDQTAGGGGGTSIGVSIVPGSSSLTDTAYQPNPVQVSVGDTITWTNDDTQPHTVTSGQNAQPDGKFDSSPNFNPLLAPGQTFSHTLVEEGQYPYFCMLHPNQVGTVIVTSAAATAGSNQTAREGQKLIERSQAERIMLEYRNPNMGLAISYPENWDVDNLAFERERSVSFFVFQGPDDVYGKFVDVRLNISGELPYFQSPDMSLDEIAQQYVTYLQDIFLDFQHNSTELGQVAGRSAYAIHYTYSDPSIGQTEAMEVIVKDGDRLYDFLYTVKPELFNTELATFRKMIDSVQIVQ